MPCPPFLATVFIPPYLILTTFMILLLHLPSPKVLSCLLVPGCSRLAGWSCLSATPGRGTELLTAVKSATLESDTFHYLLCGLGNLSVPQCPEGHRDVTSSKEDLLAQLTAFSFQILWHPANYRERDPVLKVTAFPHGLYLMNDWGRAIKVWTFQRSVGQLTIYFGFGLPMWLVDTLVRYTLQLNFSHFSLLLWLSIPRNTLW